MKKIVIALVIVILAAAGGAYVLTKKSTNNNSSTSTNTSNTNSTNEPAASTNVITYNDNGFSPSKITITSGDTVTVKNDSSFGLQIDSNPHPAHTDDTELNVGSVAKGKSVSFKLTTKGTWGYHNHLNPTDTGTITVQ